MGAVWRLGGGERDRLVPQREADRRDISAGSGPGEDDGSTATVVVDLAGQEIAHIDGVDLVPADSAAWIDDDRILCFPERDDEWHQVIVDLRDGSRVIAGTSSRNPWAGSGQRFLFQQEMSAGEPLRVVAARVDGSDPQPFLTITGAFYADGCRWLVASGGQLGRA